MVNSSKLRLAVFYDQINRSFYKTEFQIYMIYWMEFENVSIWEGVKVIHMVKMIPVSQSFFGDFRWKFMLAQDQKTISKVLN